MKRLPYHHSAKFLLTHHKLLWRVSINELKSRYAGSIIGLGWALAFPLLLMSIYAVTYLVIFQVRVPSLTPLQYVLLIFCGLVPFLMTSEALNNGVGSVMANKSVLSNTVFPIDLTPAKAVLLSQVPMVVGFAVISITLLVAGLLPWTIFLLPVVWGLQVLALIGLAWILSLISLVFRDLPNLISLLLMVIMIISPIAYTPDMVPPSLKLLLALNPFAYFVVAYQQVMIYGVLPGWDKSLILVVMSVGSFMLGSYFFSRAKRVLIDYV